MEEKGPLAFLKAAQTDARLSDAVTEAVVKGNMVTAEAVMEIAERAGFLFSREEFEAAVVESYKVRFEAGEHLLSEVAAADAPKKPLESSCAKGCLSYTKSWHPDSFATVGGR